MNPICKTVNCKRELTYLEDTKCFRCLICNPITKTEPLKEKERKYVDVKLTEVRVREIIAELTIGDERIREVVREELENWHIQKPPVTKAQILDDEAVIKVEITDSGKDWRAEAKALNISLYHKTKEKVLAEIAEKTKHPAEG